MDFTSKFAGMVGKPKSVVFMHLGKTGGKSLEDIFTRQYRNHYLIDTYAHAQHESTSTFKELAERKQFECLIGHGEFGLHEFMPQPCVYVTLLRNPVERIISDYSQIIENPNRTFHAEIKAMTFEEFLTFEKIPTNVDNGLVRSISGTDSAAFGTINQEMLQTAKANIESHFAVAGLTSRFDESILLMKEKLGWKHLPFYRRINVTQKRLRKTDFSENQIELLKERNRYDVELVEWATQRLHSQLTQINPPIDQQLSEFQKLNANYANSYPFSKWKEKLTRLLG